MEARVIAATHADLEQLVAENKFRADLFHRLHVAPILLPPLRKRLSDVPELAWHFVQKVAHASRRNAPVLSPETVELLMTYDWPGNVRELENQIARALALAGCGVIMPCDLELPGAPTRTFAVARPLDEVVRQHVRAVLKLTGGKKSRAAEILRVSRGRLDRLPAGLSHERSAASKSAARRH